MKVDKVKKLLGLRLLLPGGFHFRDEKSIERALKSKIRWISFEFKSLDEMLEALKDKEIKKLIEKRLGNWERLALLIYKDNFYKENFLIKKLEEFNELLLEMDVKDWSGAWNLWEVAGIPSKNIELFFISFCRKA